MTKVAILGAGPAGLLAAHAAELRGADVDIYSKKYKSEIGGAMYLHEPIEDLTFEGRDIHYRKRGTKEVYAEKVYGSKEAHCSWDTFEEGVVTGYPMFAIYETLWKRYSERIRELTIGYPRGNPGTSAEALTTVLASRYDVVYSTVPARVLCSDPFHTFDFAKIELYKRHDVRSRSNNLVVYNGDPQVPWYRYSKLFGIESYEFGNSLGQKIEYAQPGNGNIKTLHSGIKPLSTDCDCCPHVKRIGRFGKWQRGVLVHHAYQEVMDALQ